ncbi:MAG: Crp/Fnr family transcriptional regulator [Rhodocyclaceae bacterium]|nr:Crp/Fnr family transcriptional regulator [Rhodocyclaceae bacterium]
MPQKLADLIDGLDFFQDFSYKEIETLSRYLSQTRVDKGEVIFNEGDPGSFMLILIEGRISIYKAGENGTHLLSYEGRGRLIGEMALLDRERRSAQCVADTPCELLTIDHESLDRLSVEFPLLAYRFMFSLARLLSKRLRRTSGMLAEYLTD